MGDDRNYSSTQMGDDNLRPPARGRMAQRLLNTDPGEALNVSARESTQEAGLDAAHEAAGEAAPSAAVASDPASETLLSLWAALVLDASAPVLLLDCQTGRVLFASDAGARMLVADADHPHGPEGVAATSAGRLLRGRPLTDVVSLGFATEWFSLARRADDSGRPIAVRTRVHGEPVQLTMRPLSAGAGATAPMLHELRASVEAGLRDIKSPPPVLVTLRRLSSDQDADWGDPVALRVAPGHREDGRLEGLSAQQIAVLRMIGEGLSTTEISERLFRSPKTIEWHRMSLGRKLGVKTRVELVRIAIQAGLVNPGERAAG
jgi:DNA-binding CsgD family transcriptional regulator